MAVYLVAMWVAILAAILAAILDLSISSMMPTCYPTKAPHSFRHMHSAFRVKACSQLGLLYLKTKVVIEHKHHCGFTYILYYNTIKKQQKYDKPKNKPKNKNLISYFLLF